VNLFRRFDSKVGVFLDEGQAASDLHHRFHNNDSSYREVIYGSAPPRQPVTPDCSARSMEGSARTWGGRLGCTLDLRRRIPDLMVRNLPYS
jgi:hypothetical protein